MPSADEALDAVARVPLANLPTPLVPAPRLGRSLGLDRLLVKRDDLTGLAMGGNKARKLEYDLAPVLARGADVVVTVGGTQSNHAAMTAAAACRLGLDARLVLGGPAVERLQGNLLLEAVYGAEVRYLLDDDDNDALAAAMDRWVAELRAEGRRPEALPIGGSTGAGALGYVRAMRELVAQLGTGDFQLVTAVGSCGTLAGLALGAALFAPRVRVIGISVSRTAAQITARSGELAAEGAALLGLDPPAAVLLEVHDRFHDGYGVPTPAGSEAILLAARLEGLLLDPVYTGKSMSGLVALAREGGLDPRLPVVFLHTGGLPILFAVDGPVDATRGLTPFPQDPGAAAPAGSVR